MTIVVEKFVRKPLFVDVVKVTEENMEEAAKWCQGEIREESGASEEVNGKFIHVRVHNPKNVRQTKAYVGDYILYTEQGYKVYTRRAFNNSFQRVDTSPDMPAEATPERTEV